MADAVDMAHIDKLVQATRQQLLEGLEQMLQRQFDPLRHLLVSGTETVVRDQAEPLLLRFREVMLQTAEELAKRQLQPLVESGRQLALAVAEDVVKQHAAPLIKLLRDSMQQALEDVVTHQMEPVFQRARQGVQEGADVAGKMADVVVTRLEEKIMRPAAAFVREEMPGHTRWFGRRAMDYSLSATLYCVGAVLLVLGCVAALDALGVPLYATYFVSGMGALAAGTVFLRLFSTKVRRRRAKLLAESAGAAPTGDAS